MTKTITIYDVARQAGVSPSTVSRVMNSPEIVAPYTRQKVMQVMKELSYIPSMIAASMPRNRMNYIGLIIPDITNIFFSNIIRGIQDVCEKYGYNWLEFKNSNHLPSAIFAANDLMAIGALKAFAQLKVQVPQEVSIIGFDNIPFSDCTNPPLTTINQPTYLMGRKAVEILLLLIDKKKIKKSIELKTELVERGSVSRWEV